jgi:hypothetical protein
MDKVETGQLVCPRCKATTMRVVKTDTCTRCEHNTCVNHGDAPCEAIDPCAFQDKPESCEHWQGCDDDHECAAGHTWGQGCMLATCAMCSTIAGHLPVIEP